MDFTTEELTQQVARTARDFALRSIRPHVMNGTSNRNSRMTCSKNWTAGLDGRGSAEEYGGSGLSYIEYVVVIQEIAKVCGSIGLSLPPITLFARDISWHSK